MPTKKKKPTKKKPTAQGASPSHEDTSGRRPPNPRGREDTDAEERSDAESRADVAAAALMLPQSQSRDNLTSAESDLLAEIGRAIKKRHATITPDIAASFVRRGFGITSPTDALLDAAGSSPAEGVQITGSSRAARVPDVSAASAEESVIAVASAEFVRSRFKFAAEANPYTSFPNPDVNARFFEDRLSDHLRIALNDSNPNPASLSFALGETAQAARSLVPGVRGERVCAKIHGQVLNLNVALASIALRMGDAPDVEALTRLIVRKVFRHLLNDGSDPAAFVRKELEELRIAADVRLVKHSFAPAAASAPKSLAQPHAGVSSSPGVQPPPGLGFPPPLPAFPQMLGLGGQSRNEKFRRWVRFPRDGSGIVLMTACMLCGAGLTPGSVGHRADACGATPQQQTDWINHAIPVK